MFKNLIRFTVIGAGFMSAFAGIYLWKKTNTQNEEDPFYFYGDSLYRAGHGVTIHYDEEERKKENELEMPLERAEYLSSMVH